MTPFDSLTPTRTQEPLVKLAVSLFAFAQRIIESGEELAPIMHARAGGRQIILPLASLFMEETRDFRRPVLQRVLAQANATAYVLASEAWTLPKQRMPEGKTIDQIEGSDYTPTGRIADDPGRISALSLSGENRFGDRMLVYFEIEEGGSYRRLKPEPIDLYLVGKADDQGSVGGVLTGLLQPFEGMQ